LTDAPRARHRCTRARCGLVWAAIKALVKDWRADVRAGVGLAAAVMAVVSGYFTQPATPSQRLHWLWVGIGCTVVIVGLQGWRELSAKAREISLDEAVKSAIDETSEELLTTLQAYVGPCLDQLKALATASSHGTTPPTGSCAAPARSTSLPVRWTTSSTS
jgi:hypothetical protein